MSDRLTKAMRRLAAESAQEELPFEIEATLLETFDRANRRPREVSSRFPWMSLAGAVLASLVVVAIVQRDPYQTPAPQPATVAKAAPGPAREPEEPFVPIPYVTPLGPYERAEVVRMELPVSALISVGFPVRTPDPAALAEADVVVGQDGRARAVRLISISSFN